MLSPARRVLLHERREVPLIPRYFDLLLLLVEQRDRAVNRQEIFDRVWSDVVVSDGALTQAIRTIRRTLGDDPRESRFIRTVSRHGYQFVFATVTVESDEMAWPNEHVPLVANGLPAAEPAPDRIASLVAVLLREAPHQHASDEERYDAAVALHELGTDAALARLDERPGHEEARAILRDARWDAPAAGPVPLLASRGRLTAIIDVVALRLRRAARLASARWVAAAIGAAVAGIVAGLVGGVALGLLPDSDSGFEVALTLALVGGVAGAIGGTGIGFGLAGAEALARSARGAALTAGGAIAGLLIGSLAHQAARSVLAGVFGRDFPEMAGGFEGLVIGAAIGAGYALATRRLSQGGMAAPRGRARWRAALLTGAVTALAAAGLALASRHLVASTLDIIADGFSGSQVGLDALARLLGEESLRPVTRTLVSAFEGLMLGTGVAFGLMRRP